MNTDYRTPLVAHEQVHHLLPHRPPIVMVDLLLESSEQEGSASLYVSPDNMFVADGHMQESGLVEHMAQTLALKVAYEEAKGDTGEKFMGYLVSVKNLFIYRLPAVDEEIITKTKVTKSFGNFTIGNFKSYVNGQLIAECEMRTMVEKKEQRKTA